MMALTTKGRYAARIMVCLARSQDPTPLTKYDVGKQEGISANYVEQIMIRLKASRLVRSHRGRNGGFTLTRDPAQITLGEVLMAVEGPVMTVPCLYDNCEREDTCPTRPVWKQAAEALEEVFSRTTIHDMAKAPKGAARGNSSYQI